jgi:hypothetical protein
VEQQNLDELELEVFRIWHESGMLNPGSTPAQAADELIALAEKIKAARESSAKRRPQE